MPSLQDEWDLTMALQVLQSETVDSKIWADAVKWLLLFGPPEIREMISQASSMATSEFFPELSPIGYSEKGEPLYDIKKLAESLGMNEEEALAKMAELESELGVRSLYAASGAHRVQ